MGRVTERAGAGSNRTVTVAKFERFFFVALETDFSLAAVGIEQIFVAGTVRIMTCSAVTLQDRCMDEFALFHFIMTLVAQILT
jgi:hypothetical protein